METRFYRDPSIGDNGTPPAPAAPVAPAPVNLDALTEPDIGMPVDFTAGLPDLDHTQAAEPNPAANVQQEPAANTDNPYVDLVRSMENKYGERFQLGNDLTSENFFERLEEAMYNAKVEQTQLHPEVEKFNRAVSSGVDPNEYIRNYNQSLQVESMDPQDLVRLSLKQSFGKSEQRPNGWDDAKIDSTIKKMDSSGILEIEAEKIKTTYQYERETLSENMSNQRKAFESNEAVRINGERETQINESLAYFNKLNDISGLPLTQSEKESFIVDFKHMITPDPNTGMAPLMESLQSNENLVKVAWLLSKSDSKIREALTLAKENAKNSVYNKLDPEPRLPKRSGPARADEINLDALAEPAELSY